MTTQLATPPPLYGWAQPTVAADWTADMLERLADDGWLYELVEGRVVRMLPPGPDHGHIEWSIAHPLGAYVEAHGLGAIYVGAATLSPVSASRSAGFCRGSQRER